VLQSYRPSAALSVLLHKVLDCERRRNGADRHLHFFLLLNQMLCEPALQKNLNWGVAPS
jgi:hypothetical protein